MDNFEALATISEEFGIKKSTQRIFGVEELISAGCGYTAVTVRPVMLEGKLPEFIFEEEQGDTFCSLFSENFDTSLDTSGPPGALTFFKLHSDAEVLSSEFESEPMGAILTSEQEQQSGEGSRLHENDERFHSTNI